MKRFLYVLTIAAFLFSVTAAVATNVVETQAEKAAKTVNCCIKGQCKKAPSAADCAKAGGKVVKDCKECK